MHFTYILFSPSLDKYYIGETQNLEERLTQHRSYVFRSAFTVIASDWHIAWFADLHTRIRARKLESFFKKQKSKAFLIRFITEDDLRLSILSKFQKILVSLSRSLGTIPGGTTEVKEVVERQPLFV